MEGKDILLIILAIFIPPLAVLILKGCGGDFILNLVLTIFFFIPGIIHACYLILKDSGNI